MDIYTHLKNNLKVCKLNSSKTEIVVRCPQCGDSRKDPYKGHMYIQNQPPYKFFCQRCQSSGVINKNMLQLLECDNFVVLNQIQREYEEYSRKVKVKYGSNLSFLSNKKIVFPLPTYKDKAKLMYLEKRLGIKITDEDVEKYKIVFSITKFLKENKIDIVEKNKNKAFASNIYKLENYCVGFLSADKSTIIFRSLDPTKTYYRYNNFTIFPEVDSKKTYILANNLDLNSKVFNIHITEGIFDIIGVYNHVNNKEMKPNSLYIANAGKSYLVTSNFIKKLSILNADINIYSDNDVNVDFYRDMLKIEPFFEMNGINIFYNNKGKDFGVGKEEIELSRKIEL